MFSKEMIILSDERKILNNYQGKHNISFFLNTVYKIIDSITLSRFFSII